MGGFVTDYMPGRTPSGPTPVRGLEQTPEPRLVPERPWTEADCPDVRSAIPAECIESDGRGPTSGRPSAGDYEDVDRFQRSDSEVCREYFAFMETCFHPETGLVYQEPEANGANGQNGNGNGDEQAAGFGSIWSILGIVGISAGILAAIYTEQF